MDKETIELWLDKQIEIWRQNRMFRTLSRACGAEYATILNFDYDKKFHIEADDTVIFDMSNMLGIM